MKTLLAPRFVLALALAVAFAATPAAADSWKSNKGKSRGKHDGRYQVEDCRYRFQEHKKGHGGKMKCRAGARFAGGPPPWAPAHGYRAKSTPVYAKQEPYVPPFDLAVGRCDRDLLGAALGGTAGAVIGSQIGQGEGRTIAVIGGTIIGALIGGSIGRTMDEVDQNCVGQVLEHAPDGQAIIWQDPQTNGQYQVAPVQTVQDTDGRYCREYTATATVGGQKQETYGLACRQPDGSWQLVQ